MRNIKLTIQYDGTGYNGWQIQPNGITIQDTLQKAVRRITGEDANVTGAGRTDAGVHAIAQVASLKTSSKISQDIIKIALNANLPDDIRIMDACEERESFHPRYDAKTKTYFYVIANSRVVSPFLYKYACRVPHELSFGAMSHALSLLKGRHDFSSFRGSGCGAKNPVRTVFDISIEKLDSLSFMTAGLQGNFLKLRIKGDAFLRHMVRNIVGTVIEAGRGKINASDMEKILLSKDRRLAGPTAPARGLFLENIDY